MKDLKGLFERTEYELISGDLSGEITGIVYDTRKVEPGCLFVALKGANFDSHDAIGEVIEKGAAAVVIEDIGALESTPFSVHGTDVSSCRNSKETIIRVPNTRKALAELSAAYFDHPADTLKVIGITGTKGKTTTTYMIKSILENAGYRVGLIGTIEVVINDEHIPAKNTTPESYEHSPEIALELV